VSTKANACCVAKLDSLLDTLLNTFILSAMPVVNSFFHKSSVAEGANDGWLFDCGVG
jgi:hypothetical protein